MAQKTVVELLDDLDGSPANGTVEFGLDGVTYEIDLSGDNAALLRDELAPFVAKARKAVRATAATRAVAVQPSARSASSREQSAQIRAWAAEQGIELSARGRLPAHVVAAYNEKGDVRQTVPAVVFQAVSNP